MKGFIAFSVGWTGICGIFLLFIFTPLFAILSDSPMWIFIGGSGVVFLVWTAIMVVLCGGFPPKDERWEDIGWFRKLLLLLMSAWTFYSIGVWLIAFLVAIPVFLLIGLMAGALTVAFSGWSIYSAYTNVGSFWLAIRKWW